MVPHKQAHAPEDSRDMLEHAPVPAFERAYDHIVYRTRRRYRESPEFFFREGFVEGGKQPHDFGNVPVLVNRRPE